MYIPKNKTKRWSIQEKNEIVLLYLDQHMGRAQIMREFNIPTSSMLQRWIKQYQLFGTCVDNRGKATHLDCPNKGRPKNYKKTYQDMSKDELIKELEFRDELKNFLVYLNQQNKNTK